MDTRKRLAFMSDERDAPKVKRCGGSGIRPPSEERPHVPGQYSTPCPGCPDCSPCTRAGEVIERDHALDRAEKRTTSLEAGIQEIRDALSGVCGASLGNQQRINQARSSLTNLLEGDK